MLPDGRITAGRVIALQKMLCNGCKGTGSSDAVQDVTGEFTCTHYVQGEDYQKKYLYIADSPFNGAFFDSSFNITSESIVNDNYIDDTNLIIELNSYPSEKIACSFIAYSDISETIYFFLPQGSTLPSNNIDEEEYLSTLAIDTATLLGAGETGIPCDVYRESSNDNDPILTDLSGFVTGSLREENGTYYLTIRLYLREGTLEEVPAHLTLTVTKTDGTQTEHTINMSCLTSSGSDSGNCVIAGYGSPASTEGTVLEDNPEEETRFNELSENDVLGLKTGGIAVVIDSSYDPGSWLRSSSIHSSEQEGSFKEGYYEPER